MLNCVNKYLDNANYVIEIKDKNLRGRELNFENQAIHNYNKQHNSQLKFSLLSLNLLIQDIKLDIITS